MIITGNFNNDYHNNQNITHPYIVHVVVIKQFTVILYRGMYSTKGSIIMTTEVTKEYMEKSKCCFCSGLIILGAF